MGCRWKEGMKRINIGLDQEVMRGEKVQSIILSSLSHVNFQVVWSMRAGSCTASELLDSGSVLNIKTIIKVMFQILVSFELIRGLLAISHCPSWYLYMNIKHSYLKICFWIVSINGPCVDLFLFSVFITLFFCFGMPGDFWLHARHCTWKL